VRSAGTPARNCVPTSGDKRQSAVRRRVPAGCGISNTSRGDSRMVSGARKYMSAIDISRSLKMPSYHQLSGRIRWQRSARSPLRHEGLSRNICLSLSHSHLLPHSTYNKIHDFMPCQAIFVRCFVKLVRTFCATPFHVVEKVYELRNNNMIALDLESSGPREYIVCGLLSILRPPIIFIVFSLY